MVKKRKPPPLPGLFNEEALHAIVVGHGFHNPKMAVPLIYRIAIRELRKLADLDESVVVATRIETWREATRRALARAGRGLPPSLADAVVDGMAFMTLTLVTNEDSEDGGTSKLLLETHDAHRVEAVVIRRHGRSTSICVSSQVGCQMGCQFCATGTMGIIGDLTTAEILEQAVYSYLAPSSLPCLPVRNIVFMGMGEPLNNFSNVRAAVDGFTDFSRFGLGRPHVTVSTVGVVPYMKQLTQHLPGVALALSLHAPNQALREQIVPAARGWPMDKLMAALDAHIEASTNHDAAGEAKVAAAEAQTPAPEEQGGEEVADTQEDGGAEKKEGWVRLPKAYSYWVKESEAEAALAVKKPKQPKFTGVMIEYVLLGGVNDTEEHAKELVALLHGKPVLINLIPYNPNVTAEIHGFEAPTEEHARFFGRILIESGLHARVRIERGSDIAAACGQLALTAVKGAKGGSGLVGGNAATMRDIEDIVAAPASVTGNLKAKKKERAQAAQARQRQAAKGVKSGGQSAGVRNAGAQPPGHVWRAPVEVLLLLVWLSIIQVTPLSIFS